MPSIFVWKSAESNNSKVTVRYFSGSNWFLEDNDGVARSFLLQDQEVITDSTLSDTIIVFNAKEMKKDWVGTELLEVTQLPYKLIKTDSFGTLDMIGDWFRFISDKPVSTITISEWIVSKPTNATSRLDFNNFLIKLDNIHTNVKSTHNVYKNSNRHHQKFHKNQKQFVPYRGSKSQ
jgi:hypothetical protein